MVCQKVCKQHEQSSMKAKVNMYYSPIPLSMYTAIDKLPRDCLVPRPSSGAIVNVTSLVPRLSVTGGRESLGTRLERDVIVEEWRQLCLEALGARRRSRRGTLGRHHYEGGATPDPPPCADRLKKTEWAQRNYQTVCSTANYLETRRYQFLMSRTLLHRVPVVTKCTRIFLAVVIVLRGSVGKRSSHLRRQCDSYKEKRKSESSMTYVSAFYVWSY